MNSPNWLRRRTEIPAPPPSENPLTDAMEQWHGLQANYASAVDQLREADELNQRLALELESLRRENEHIRKTCHEQVMALQRERNLLAAYGTEVRTQLTIIREVIESAERKALEAAAQVNPPDPKDVIDDAETERIAQSIVRLNPNRDDSLPPNRM